ncbi:M23 family metallopeptidase [Kitasatospora sp. LaBMicrA B282]|uniref:M23 family metallopeptidase n=1 Tax=Kitasatospora sp. LaBMicrA B282 TaxID=3420949 RepID=UPI003D0ED98B
MNTPADGPADSPADTRAEPARPAEPERFATRPSGGRYPVFHGRHRHKAISSALAGAALLGVALAAVPGSAAAQTVHPTTPESSAFGTARGPLAFDTMVQLSAPSAYRASRGHRPGGQAVSVAGSLATAAHSAPLAPPAPPAAPHAPTAPERPTPPVPPSAPGWSPPAPGARISYRFGVPDAGYAAGYHTGVDFAVSSGTPLLAVADATVVSAGWAGAYGNEVVLQLPDGHFAQYAHLSRLDVEEGQRVTAGQRLGASGMTGNATGPHLHFEIRTVNTYGAVIDPVAYLQAHGVNGL